VTEPVPLADRWAQDEEIDAPPNEVHVQPRWKSEAADETQSRPEDPKEQDA